MALSVGPSQAAVRDVVSRLLLWEKGQHTAHLDYISDHDYDFSVFRNRLYFTKILIKRESLNKSIK